MSTSRKKRCFTVMIVPHSEEATHSLRIPLYVVQVVVALFILGVAGFCVLGYGYLKASAVAEEAEILRQLSRAQQEEINSLAIETEKMMEQIYAIDDLVDMVTDKLDMEPGDFEEGLQNQSAGNNLYTNNIPPTAGTGHAMVHTTGTHDTVRAYESRSSTNGVLERAIDNISLLQSVVPERTETLDSVGEYVVEVEAAPSIWPARGRVSSGFGVRRIPYSSGYQFHTGVDIIGAHGSAVWASAPGTVKFAAYRGSFGNLVIVDHGYGYETHYAHLSDFAVSRGDTVERGQTIGYMGATGRTTGTHLHYEVHRNNSPVNPSNYMKKR